MIDGVGSSVGPWLTAETVWEVSICSTDGHVEDDVEVLVEWGVVAAAFPRVVLVLPATLLKEALSRHVDVKDDVRFIIDVCEESIFGPDEAIGVHFVSKRFRVSISLRSLDVSVLVPVWSPMESRGELVVAAN